MKGIKARGYQKECLAEIAETVEAGGKRALVVMASGLGKTLTSAFAIEEFFKDRDLGRVLILCHSEAILMQSKEKYKGYFGEQYSYGMFTSHARTTRSTDFLFATFQTMRTYRKEFDRSAFSYIVVDEAHHSHAQTYFPTIKYFEPEFLLGLTATPDRLDGQNIEEIYGAPVYELGFIEATGRGLLAECDYQLVLDDMSQEKLDECLQGNESISVAQINRTVFVPKRDEEIVRLIRKYSAEQEDPKTMIFCKTIEHARRITKLMGTEATVVHKCQNSLDNDLALEAFRSGKVRTIVSVQMLNEGIDVPDANVIVFLRNTVSKTIFYQQLGRGIRLSPGKDKVKVLDFVANCERIQTVLELKQEIDNFRMRPPHSDEGSHGDGHADSREKFTLNIATPEFKASKVDILQIVRGAFNRRRYWSDEELILILQTKSRELGRTPCMKDFNNDPECPGSLTFVDHFGSWNEALLAADLPLNIITNESLIEKLQAKAKQLGRTPSFKEVMQDKDMPSAATYRQRFGSWAQALRVAKLKVSYQTAAVSEGVNRDKMLSALQKKAKKLGRTPKGREVNTDKNMPCVASYRKEFGSWNDALLAAGLEASRKVRPSHRQ